MEQENMNDFVSTNHNHHHHHHPHSAANHINPPHLNRAMAHNGHGDNAAQQSYTQSHGAFPTSYNDFFAGNTWAQPVQNPGAVAASSRPSSALQHQPWEHQNAHHLNPSVHNQGPHRNQSPLQQVNNYPPVSGNSHVNQLTHDRLPYTEQHRQQHVTQFPISTSTSPAASSAHPNLAAKQADSSYMSHTADQQAPFVYVPPYSKPQQFPQQPIYGHAGQFPGYGIQYPQIHAASRPVEIKPTQPAVKPPQVIQVPSLQQQVHQILSDVPQPAKLQSNPRFTVIDTKKLCEKTNSKLVNPLLAVGQTPIELAHSKVTQLPRFEARKNLLELRQLVGQDPDLKLRIAKLDKKVRSKVASIVSTTVQQASGTPVLKTTSSSSSEDESSDSSVDSEDDLEIEEKIPVPASRPTDPIKGAEYDVIKAVWHPRSTYLENVVLLQRIAQFSDLFSKLRDRWKVSNDALKEAEQAKSTSQIASLTNKVNQNRKIVEVALRAAVLHGHSHILSMLGENKKLVAGMYGLLSDRINKKSYDDPLSVIALRFLDQLTSITTETLDTTKLIKALPYFVKRGTDNVKALAKRIIDRAAENTKKEGKASSNAAISKSSGVKAEPKAVAADAASETSLTSNSLKRPRVLEPLSAQPAKRQAVATAVSKNATTAVPSVSKRPVTTVGSKTSASSALVKPKIAVKPAVTNTVAKKPVPATTKAAPSTRAAEPSKSGFSFGGMMQNILKPAVPEPKEIPEELVPTETEEEKTKRLRKETRRKLRVSWKSDHDLCAIKYFTHDPDEETGHDASSVRDVTDVGNEGRMFKQLHKDHKEIVDVELEEEEKEEHFNEQDWVSPLRIDFSDLNDPDVEWNKIYQPYGRGELQPESSERDVQKQREAATLMAVYITRDDIPSRPQSPVEAMMGDANVPSAFGAPDERTKRREQGLKAPPSVDMDAIARILGNTSSTPMSTNIQSTEPVQPVPQQAPVPPQMNPQDLLAALQSLSNPTASSAPPAAIEAPQPPAVSTSVHDANNLAFNPLALAGLLGGVPFPPQPIPSSAPPPIDFSALLSQFQNQAATNTQQPMAPPPMPIPPAVPAIPNVADLWAQLGIAQPPQPPPVFPAFNANGAIPQQMQQADNTQYNGQYEHPDRKRFRETGDDDLDDDQWNKRPNPGMGAGRGGGNAKNWDSQRKPKWSYEDNSKKFTLPCKFWPMGKCTKGANCTYRHDM